MDSNVVRVNILGQEYVMKTSADPKYIQDVAKYVNEKMDEIKQSGVDSSSQQLKISVLGAGLMGHGIASVFAAAGYRVSIYDPDKIALKSVVKRFSEIFTGHHHHCSIYVFTSTHCVDAQYVGASQLLFTTAFFFETLPRFSFSVTMPAVHLS